MSALAIATPTFNHDANKGLLNQLPDGVTIKALAFTTIPLASDQDSPRVGATSGTSTQGANFADMARRYNSHDLEGTERPGPNVAIMTRLTLTTSRSSNI